MKWTFRIASIGLGLGLAFGAVAVLRPAPLDVDVSQVVRGALAQTVVDDGRARVRERYTVSAPVTGSLARIELHEGDVVEPGSVLARLLPLASPLLDPESRRAAEQRLASAIDASAQAKSTVVRAQIADDQAKTELLRNAPLAQQGSIPMVQLDQAVVAERMRQSELLSAGFAEKVAEHEIEQARSALARFTPGRSQSEQLELTSPVHGEVLHVLRKSEGVVNAGTALLEVGDARALELVADVLSQDAVAIQPGMPARILHWGGEPALAAKVRLIEPAAFTKTSALGVDEQRVNVVLDLDDPPDRWRALGDGFAVEIEITIWSKPDALQVPTSALFRGTAGWEVFVVEAGRANKRAVEPGHRGPLRTEIVKGLRAGEVVIIHPGAGVHDGVKVAYR
jgi:HlyD family secretion protein